MRLLSKMKTFLYRRLTGILITLVALALVYVALFRYEHARQAVSGFMIPEAPSPPVHPSGAGTAPEAAITPAKSTNAKSDDNSGHKSETARAWMLQVARFDNESAAIALRKKLDAAGIVSAMANTIIDGRRMYTLTIGPDTDKQWLKSLQAKTGEMSGQQSTIIPFEVTGVPALPPDEQQGRGPEGDAGSSDGAPVTSAPLSSGKGSVSEDK